MLKSKQFVKVNRKGNVVKIVREHYLRNDIGCGCFHCAACASLGPMNQMPRVLLSHLSHHVQGDTRPSPVCFVFDTNIYLHHMDAVEHPAFHDVIVLETALDELRHQQWSIYHRLRQLIKTTDRRFYVFLNEHHHETYVESIVNESDNDRNDRSIRVATQWYQRHLKILESPANVLLVTNDKGNLALAQSLGLQAMTLTECIHHFFPDVIELVDMAASSTEKEGEEKIKILYDDYLSSSELQRGLKNGTFLQGTLNVNRYILTEAWVKVPQHDRPLLIQGHASMNRATHDDTVVIEILPETSWSCPVSMLDKDKDSDDDGNEKEDLDEIADQEEKESFLEREPSKSPTAVFPTAKVIGIVKRAWRGYAGSIEYTPRVASAANDGVSRTQTVLFTPFERRIPRIRLRTCQAERLAGQRLVVAIDRWERRARYPEGHFVRVLGAIGDRQAETTMLLLENDVIDRPFSSSVLADLPPDTWQVDSTACLREDPHRVDLRHLDVCSIDPPGCTDIDDALHVRAIPNGHLEVGVHIADVSFFVSPATSLDEEARERGTSVYLVDKRIDMLPAVLGSNLCSLRADVDRLAFSCLWEISLEGEVISTRFARSIIRSRHSFTYEKAQSWIDDTTKTDDIAVGLRQLNAIAKKMRAKRLAAGALTLASPEVKFHLENESQDPLDVEMKPLRETNALVEEFMLLANVAVARKIYHHFPECALLRRHAAPPATNFDTLVTSVRRVTGIKLDPSSSKSLADSLDHAIVPGDPYINTLIRILTTRCMMQAVYFCSGAMSFGDFHHYGLATPIYTHFTSPIRRYADLLVHRLLAACINPLENSHTVVAAETLDQQRMVSVCENLNYRHRNAQMAARSSVELFTLLYFKGRVVVEDAYVLKVHKNGVVVLIPKYGIEGIVYTSNSAAHKELPAAASLSKSPSLVYIEEQDSLVSDDGKYRLTIFQKLTVQVSIDMSNLQRQKLQLQLISPYIPGLSPDKETMIRFADSAKRQKTLIV